MVPLLKVVTPGLHTTVQDFGRRGFQDVGVPVSGALDRVSLRLANALVGNAPGEPALEILLHGPSFEVMAESVRVALVGGTGGIEVAGEGAVPTGQSVRLPKGARLRVTPLGNVSCAYLAIEGGVAVPLRLGSASTYVRGALGGHEGRPLAPGDIVAGRADSVEDRGEVAFARAFDPGLDQPLRVVLGPQQDYFTDAALELFLGSDYRVTQQADRMGFRLEGPPLAHARGYNIVSDAIVAGSIQVPGSGQPIVLLVDAQTTGGYPKIATVVSADIPVLGRRKAGSTVRFAAVTQPEAEALRRAEEASVGERIAAFRPVKRGGWVDLTALYEANLIDGMVDALG